MWHCIQETKSLQDKKTPGELQRLHKVGVYKVHLFLRMRNTQDIWKLLLQYAEGWPLLLRENEDKHLSFFFCQVEAVQILFMVFPRKLNSK